MQKLSVVLATFNEEKNLTDCLESVKGLADEIVIVDGSSRDSTVEIAKKFGAKVHVTDNPPIFHINKQKALELAKNEWILQLDADERISHPLKNEIIKILNLTEKELEDYEAKIPQRKLFERHQKLIEKRDGKIGTQGPYVAFFIPRLNYFLGKYLRYGGVYPDGVIRLIKKNKSHFPCVSVHEQIAVNGKVGWLQNPLYHKDSPTFRRYLERNKRYINLIIKDFQSANLQPNIFNSIKYLLVLPLYWLILTFIRHKGFLDSWQGFVFSFFSALRFPRAYLKYLKISDKIIR